MSTESLQTNQIRHCFMKGKILHVNLPELFCQTMYVKKTWKLMEDLITLTFFPVSRLPQLSIQRKMKVYEQWSIVCWTKEV